MICSKFRSTLFVTMSLSLMQSFASAHSELLLFSAKQVAAKTEKEVAEKRAKDAQEASKQEKVEKTQCRDLEKSAIIKDHVLTGIGLILLGALHFGLEEQP